MAKEIEQGDIDVFRAHCADAVKTGGYMTIEGFPSEFKVVDDEGEPLWEFMPDDDEHYDFYDMFEAVGDQFDIEEEGHGSFLVSRV